MPARLTAFYARLTREDAASASIENQVQGFEDLRQRHGWPSRHFIEQGRRASGEWTPAKRPALYQLLEAVERGEVERVVVRHLDRLGRGPILLQVLDQLGESGVDVWDFTGPVDYRTAAGELGTGVQALVGRFEVRRTGERIRAARRGWWLKGVHVGPCPYGYTSQSRIRGELIAAGVDPLDAQVQAQVLVPIAPGLILDEGEAQVVRDIYAGHLERAHAFLAALAHGLAAAPLRLREFVTLAQRHQGLVAVAESDQRVAVSLTISTAALAGRGPDVPLLLARTVSTGHLTRAEWVAQEQGRHLCACGCGRAIRLTVEMHTRGVPSYVRGHHPKRATAEAAALAAAGLCSLAEAAAQLGMGETTLARAVARGVVPAPGRGWGRVRTFALAELPALREALIAAGHRFADGPLLTTPEAAAALGVPPRRLAALAPRLAVALEAAGAVLARDTQGRWIWRRGDLDAVRAVLAHL